MAERARRIEDRYQAIADEAEKISRTVEQFGVSIQKKPGLREYVKESPYWTLGVAAGIGYLASRLFRARSAPPEQIMDTGAREVLDSHGGLHTKSAGLGLIKATLLGVAAKAAVDLILNAASSTGTRCGSPEPRPKTGSDSTINQRADTLNKNNPIFREETMDTDYDKVKNHVT